MSNLIVQLTLLLGGLVLIGVALGMVMRGAIRLVAIGILALIAAIAVRFTIGRISDIPFATPNLTQPLSPSPSSPSPRPITPSTPTPTGTPIPTSTSTSTPTSTAEQSPSPTPETATTAEAGLQQELTRLQSFGLSSNGTVGNTVSAGTSTNTGTNTDANTGSQPASRPRPISAGW